MKIALVEWNWGGHHPTYFNHFILAMEELGFDVLALCPNPAEAAETANNTRNKSGANMSGCGRTEFARINVPARRYRLRSASLINLDWSVRFFTGLERQVRAAAGGAADAIFYACIYDVDFEWMHLARSFLRLPWMGLYLHALSYRMPGQANPYTWKVPRPEKVFGGGLCRGIGLLDEGIVEQVSRSLGKPVVALPDLTDERPAVSAADRLLGGRLKQFAAGRPIVGLFGHLQRSKGIQPFLEAARQTDPAEICFALAGEVNWAAAGDTKKIQLALAECPHLWNHLARIPGEPRLNDLLSVCDVLCAAYVDFPHSSGIQTKAAVLEKPLIVSDGYLMAERTRRFNLGEVVPQENTGALLAAISKITKNRDAWMAATQPRWVEYCREHSFERLKRDLGKLLAGFATV
jgi:glycosyltransferase involved in cell wall biosynthesis